MRLTVLSDTHNRHESVRMPAKDPATGTAGGLLVHCGDATTTGTRDEWAAFADWLASQAEAYEHGALFVPGNHDLIWRDDPQLAREIAGGRFRVETFGSLEIGGRRLFASSWTPKYKFGRETRWAFHYERGVREAAAHWRNVPIDTEILVTHGPPLSVLDGSGDRFGNENAGCPALLSAVAELNLMGELSAHLFGHIHSGHGRLRWNQQDAQPMLFVNAAICDNEYEPVGVPQEVEL